MPVTSLAKNLVLEDTKCVLSAKNMEFIKSGSGELSKMVCQFKKGDLICLIAKIGDDNKVDRFVHYIPGPFPGTWRNLDGAKFKFEPDLCVNRDCERDIK